MLNYAIALTKEGSLGKACKVLTSSGIAADNESTFQLPLDKHPQGLVHVIVPLDFDL